MIQGLGHLPGGRPYGSNLGGALQIYYFNLIQ